MDADKSQNQKHQDLEMDTLIQQATSLSLGGVSSSFKTAATATTSAAASSSMGHIFSSQNATVTSMKDDGKTQTHSNEIRIMGILANQALNFPSESVRDNIIKIISGIHARRIDMDDARRLKAYEMVQKAMSAAIVRIHQAAQARMGDEYDEAMFEECHHHHSKIAASTTASSLTSTVNHQMEDTTIMIPEKAIESLQTSLATIYPSAFSSTIVSVTTTAATATATSTATGAYTTPAATAATVAANRSSSASANSSSTDVDQLADILVRMNTLSLLK
jgi:hypothetical protein